MAKGEESKSETKKTTSTSKSGKSSASGASKAKSSTSAKSTSTKSATKKSSSKAKTEEKGNYDDKPIVEVGKKNVKVAGVKMKKKTALIVALAIIAIILVAVIVFVVLYETKPDFKNTVDEWWKYNFVDKGNGNGNGGSSSGGGNSGGSTVISEGELQVHMLDVGQGDCILILFPDGKEMLIDCGNKSTGYNYEETTKPYLEKYITDGQIDYLMLTHCDEDHVDQLDKVLAGFVVDNIYMPNVKSGSTKDKFAEQFAALPADRVAMFTDEDTIDSDVYTKFYLGALTEVASDGNLADIILNVGNFAIEGETYKIDFFGYTAEEWKTTNLSNAHKKNAISPIGILQYNGKRVVLTGDSNVENEPIFIKKAKEFYGVDKLDCDVLKVGHHGSETSTTDEFLDFITVEYAFISCKAAGNTFYHPRQATLDRLIARNITFYRTDLNGNIVCKISGTTIAFTVDTEVDKSVLDVGLTGKTS